MDTGKEAKRARNRRRRQGRKDHSAAPVRARGLNEKAAKLLHKYIVANYPGRSEATRKAAHEAQRAWRDGLISRNAKGRAKLHRTMRFSIARLAKRLAAVGG